MENKKPETATTMTMAEAAGYLGISITTFKEHYKSWRVPCYRLGTRVLFRRDDLEES